MVTGNVLSPHKYFQFERTLKNVVMNSESAFWDTLWKATCLGFVPKYLGMTWMDESPSWGAHLLWPARGGAAPWSSSSLPIMPLLKLHVMGFLGISSATLPLGFFYK